MNQKAELFLGGYDKFIAYKMVPPFAIRELMALWLLARLSVRSEDGCLGDLFISEIKLTQATSAALRISAGLVHLYKSEQPLALYESMKGIPDYLGKFSQQ